MKVELSYIKTDDLVGKKVVASAKCEDYKTLEFILVFDDDQILYYRTSTHFEDHFVLCSSFQELNEKVKDVSSKISEFYSQFLLEQAIANIRSDEPIPCCESRPH